jgi:hypothetical protein
MVFKNKWIALSAAAFFLTQIPTAQAWDATGHIIIAQIAYNNLTYTAQQDVDYLIGQTDFAHSFPDFSTFVYAAPWPDYFNYEVKPPTGETQTIFSFLKAQAKPWHHIDDPIVVGNYQPKPPSANNSLWAMNYLIPNLSELLQEKKYDLAAYDLVFITHIVGDMHQPLHNANLYDSDFPNGDAGGNLYKIKSTFGATQLHAVWDESLGAFNQWEGYSPNAGYHPPMNNVEQTAAQFQTLCGQHKAKDLNPADWEKKSHKIAANYVYPIKNNDAPGIDQALSKKYVSDGQKIAAYQMCLAGKRLAGILNIIFTQPIGS